jgi:hypothetical protein
LKFKKINKVREILVKKNYFIKVRNFLQASLQKNFYLEHVHLLCIESESPMPNKLKEELDKSCKIEYASKNSD